MAELLIHAQRDRFGERVERVLDLGQLSLGDVNILALHMADLLLFLRVAATGWVTDGGTVGLGC